MKQNLDSVLRKDLITDHVTIASDIDLRSNNALPVSCFPLLPFHIIRVAIAVDQFAVAFNSGRDMIHYWSLMSHLSVWKWISITGRSHTVDVTFQKQSHMWLRIKS